MSDRRTGNIAQLPHALRDQVNHMLDDGCRYQKIIAWLESNGHPGIKPNNLSDGEKAVIRSGSRKFVNSTARKNSSNCRIKS